MKRSHRHALVAVLFGAVATLAAVAAATAGAQAPSLHAADAAGIIWEHGHDAHGNGARSNRGGPNLIYHGGPVQTSTTEVFPIFWGTSWTSSSSELTGIDGLYAAVGRSSYVRTNAEYTNSAGAGVSTSVHENGVTIDNSAAPTRAPQTTAILAEVAKVYGTPTAGAYYPVYIDQPRGNAGYCAWHSSGTINGVQVEFGFFFKLDGDPGCDPQSPYTNDEGLAALGNVTGHELSETLTDPQLNAWYDQQGEENADKCAWTFSGNPVVIGGTSWRIQGNWSNNAYNANRGYVRGCIDTA